MEPLTRVCAESRVDYFMARAALLRGEISGKYEGRRLLVDRLSLERWREAKAAAERALFAPPAAGERR